MSASPDPTPVDPIDQLLNTLSDLYASQRDNIRNQTKTLARIETILQQLRQKLHESPARGASAAMPDVAGTPSQPQVKVDFTERPTNADPAVTQNPVSAVDTPPGNAPTRQTERPSPTPSPNASRKRSLYRTLEDEQVQPSYAEPAVPQPPTADVKQPTSESSRSAPTPPVPPVASQLYQKAPTRQPVQDSAQPMPVQQMIEKLNEPTPADELEGVKSFTLSPDSPMAAAPATDSLGQDPAQANASEPQQLFPPESDDGIDERNLLEQIHRFTETLSESTAFWQQVTIPRGISPGVPPIQSSDSESGVAAQYENNSRSPYSH